MHDERFDSLVHSQTGTAQSRELSPSFELAMAISTLEN